MTRDPLDAAELAEIEARAAKATEGPWGVVDDTYVEQTTGGNVAKVFLRRGSIADAQADAAFIAHARTDISRMAAELRRAWAEIERLQEDASEPR